MMDRRIVETIGPFLHVDKAVAEPRCRKEIVLDGIRYLCGGADHTSGIHDAFAVHVDGGMVRW